MSGEISCVLIAGPTASGKSALALDVARATGGAIVNADSMQVYRQLRILSARPSETEEHAAAHHLFGVADAYQPFSVARWLDMARAVLSDLSARGQLAIVTGGTGLYFKALVEGLADAPSSTPEGRASAQARRAELGPEAFHAELVRLDPASAHLNAGDTQRTLRAWEVVTVSGRGLTAWQAAVAEPVVSAAASRRFVVDIARPDLNRRIDSRFDVMVAEGALEEARAFWAGEPDPALPAAKALGLPQFKRALDGELTVAAAIEEAKLQTRRFAKRQSTWFRNQTGDWARVSPDTAASAKAILETL